MALTPVTYVIEPNAVTGTQQLSDPTGGNIPADPVAPVTNLTITANTHDSRTISWSYSESNHDGFEIEELIVGVDPDWQTETNAGPTDRSHTTSGDLPASTLVKHRVRAYNSDGASTWASVEAETEAAPSNPNPNIDLDKLHYYENFTGGSVGQNIDQSTSLFYASSTVITTSNPYPGGTNRSARSTVRKGTNGYGEWGFIWENSRNGKPSPLEMKRGGETWYRCAIRYDPGWEWGDDNGPNQSAIIKGFRFYRGSDGNESGSNNFYPRIDRAGNMTGYVTGATSEQDRYLDWPRVTRPTAGQWYMWECYIKWDTLGVDKGGEGEFKLWQDGAYLGNQYWDRILKQTNDYSSRFMMHTYWNGDAPRTQSCQYAHAAWAYRGPTTSGSVDMTGDMDRDENGFPFIGMSVK